MPKRKKQQKELSEFAERLTLRLQMRKSKGRQVWVLDFRCGEFAILGRKTQMLLDPFTIGGIKGEPTAVKEEAEKWIKHSYAMSIRAELAAKEAERDLVIANDALVRQVPELVESQVLTVARACDIYLEGIRALPGHSKHTHKNRKSICDAHIKPALGLLALSSLDAERVSTFLDELRVRSTGDNKASRTRVPNRNYLRIIKHCLVAIWRANIPGADPSFADVSIPGGTEGAVRRDAAFRGDTAALLKPKGGAQTPPQVRRTLLAAMWYDRVRISDRKSTSGWAVPNTAEAMAFEICTGARSEETVLTRWKCIDEDAGAILILGTKSTGGLRWVPYQDQLRPWIARVRDRLRPKNAGPNWRPDPDDFVFPTRFGAPPRMGSTRTLGNRFTRALTAANLKIAGKATHHFRATFASMVENKLTSEQLKAYLGHSDPHGGATDRYTAHLVPYMPPEHRQLIEHLPSPQELEPLIGDFVPAELPKPGERRSRAKRPVIRALQDSRGEEGQIRQKTI